MCDYALYCVIPVDAIQKKPQTHLPNCKNYCTRYDQYLGCISIPGQIAWMQDNVMSPLHMTKALFPTTACL